MKMTPLKGRGCTSPSFSVQICWACLANVGGFLFVRRHLSADKCDSCLPSFSLYFNIYFAPIDATVTMFQHIQQFHSGGSNTNSFRLLATLLLRLPVGCPGVLNSPRFCFFFRCRKSGHRSWVIPLAFLCCLAHCYASFKPIL